MSDARFPDVVVVGGAAGAVIAHRLAEQGKRVYLLNRTDVLGATDNNQKWLHSGLLYPSSSIAERAWLNRNQDWEIKRHYLVGEPQARILALNSETVQERKKMWEEWENRGLNVPRVTDLPPGERNQLKAGGFSFVDGWITPDCVIDFPALVRDMRLNLEGKFHDESRFPRLKQRGVLMEGARVLRLRRGRNGVTGVDYDWNSDQRTLLCDQCILAAGAWSYELLKEINVELPIIRKKCIVLSFKRDSLFVDKITVWLDVKKEDGTRADFTLVPFHQETLAAGTDFKVVYQLDEKQKLEELGCGSFEVEALKAELQQCLPGKSFATGTYEPRVCYKTEHYNPAHPDVDLKVYTSDNHGVPGLVVAFPGKASFIFDLAEEVSKHVH